MEVRARVRNAIGLLAFGQAFLVLQAAPEHKLWKASTPARAHPKHLGTACTGQGSVHFHATALQKRLVREVSCGQGAPC